MDLFQSRKPSFVAFRNAFVSKPMNESAFRYKNDCVLLSEGQGLLSIQFPSSASVEVTKLDENNDLDIDSGRYLWVVTTSEGLHALEARGNAIGVGAGLLKHSNLTGGGDANGGGELWYWQNSDTVIVNAHSGRYGSRLSDGVEMAQALVSALRECGFRAATTGIEQDTNSLRAYPDPDAQLDY